MVKEAVDYPWSSARFHLGVSQGDALVKDKSLLGLVKNWAEYLNVRDEPAIQRTLFEGFVPVGLQEATNS